MAPRAILLFYGGGVRVEDEETGIITIPVEDYDPLPRVRDVVLVLDSASDTPAVVTRRRVDIQNLFRQGGRLIVLFGPRSAEAWGRSIGLWLSDTLQLSFSSGNIYDVQSKRPELNRFLHEQVAYGAFARRRSDLPLEPLALSGDDQVVVAGRLSHQNAQVVLVPVRSPDQLIQVSDELLRLLPRAEEYPRHLDNIPLANEAELRAELEQVSTRMVEIESELSGMERMKAILYKTDFDLQDEVSHFLNDFLGVPTRPEASNREDFWLLDDEGMEVVIGEVKGSGKQNVDRGDVGALLWHRKTALETMLPNAKPDTFPALLVVNTFHRKQTREERDIPPPHDIVKAAAESHVLIVRTLDLVRALDIKLREDDPPDVRGAALDGGGWLAVNEDLTWTRHTK
jgi:hypothetical protein